MTQSADLTPNQQQMVQGLTQNQPNPTPIQQVATQQYQQNQNSAQQQLQDFNVRGPRRMRKPAPPTPDDDVEEGISPTPVPKQVKKAADKADEEAQRIRQVGGLAIAVIILIVLIWLIIPTKSGYTRLQLFWFMLIGRADLSTNTSGGSGGEGPATGQVQQTSQQSGVTTNQQENRLNSAIQEPDLNVVLQGGLGW